MEYDDGAINCWRYVYDKKAKLDRKKESLLNKHQKEMLYIEYKIKRKFCVF